MSRGNRAAPTSPPVTDQPSLLAPTRLDRPFDDPLFRRLFPPLATGVHWGLARTRAALGDLGDPHRRYPVVHVGGTNGKGSVASTVHAVLDEASGPGRLRAGLYTSPHLCSLTERFRIGGAPVAEELLVRYADEIRDVVVRRELTFFEAVTVLGFHLFAEEGAEILVAEVGLGGRLDATNVLEPVCTAITNVAMDHAEYLGETLTEIAGEKAGIIKPDVPLVTAEADPSLLSVFREVARERGAPITAIAPEDLKGLEVAPDHTAFSFRTNEWGELRLRTPLVGPHHAANTAVALGLLERLPESLRPTRSEVEAGVRAVRWPGRDQLEVVDGATWFFDVAHNTAGVRSLVDTLDRLELPAPPVAVVGVLGDKDWRSMLRPLLDRCASAVLTVPPSAPVGRRWDPVVVAGELTPGVGCTLRVEEDFGAALTWARSRGADGFVIVTGSVYTVGSAMRRLGLDPY